MTSFLQRLLGGAPTVVQTVRGMRVEVENTRSDIVTEDVIARLDEALQLIAQYQPARFRHLQRDVQRVRVERFPTRGAFMPATRTVLTELTFLARRDISAAPVASSILHEGVHARVCAFRSRVVGTSTEYAYGTDIMAREERLCRRAELAFGLSLPATLGAPVVERALASLQMTDHDVAPVIDWNEATLRQQAIDRAAPSE